MNRARLQTPGQSYNIDAMLWRAKVQGVDLHSYGSGALPQAIDQNRARNISLRQVAEVHYLEMARSHYATHCPGATVLERHLWQAYDSADEVVLEHLRKIGKRPSTRALQHMQAYKDSFVPRLSPDLVQNAVWQVHRQDPSLLDLPVLTIIDSAARLNEMLEDTYGLETMLPYDLEGTPGSCSYEARGGTDMCLPRHVALLGDIQEKLKYGVTLFAQFDDIVVTQIFPLWLQDALIQLGISDHTDLASLATLGLQDPVERFLGMMLHHALGIFFDFEPADHELEGHASSHELALHDLEHLATSLSFGIDEDIFAIMRPVYDFVGPDFFTAELLYGDLPLSEIDRRFEQTFDEFTDGLPLTGGANLQAWHHRAGQLWKRYYDQLR